MVYDLDVIRLVKQTKDHEFVPDHIHEGIYHYLFIISGEGYIIIEGQRYDLKEADLATVPPGFHHEIYGTNHMCSIDLKFRCSGFLADYLSWGGYRFEGLNSYECGLIREMFDIALSPSSDKNHLVNMKMLELLVYLHKRTLASGESADLLTGEFTLDPLSPLNNEYLSKVKLAVDTIDAHLSSPLSIAELSAQCGYTPTYFSQIFRSIIGVSPKRYINQKKISRAKAMILSENLNISQISEILGFESVHYFSRVFKNLTGIAPMDYSRRVNSDTGISLIDGIIPLKEDGFELTKQPIVPED